MAARAVVPTPTPRQLQTGQSPRVPERHRGVAWLAVAAPARGDVAVAAVAPASVPAAAVVVAAAAVSARVVRVWVVLRRHYHRALHWGRRRRCAWILMPC